MVAPPPQILITGAMGWLGKRLTRLLADGTYDPLLGNRPALRCLVLPGQDGAELRAMGPQVEVVVGDLRKPGDCARFIENARAAVLIHTAGIIHPHRVQE